LLKNDKYKSKLHLSLKEIVYFIDVFILIIVAKRQHYLDE